MCIGNVHCNIVILSTGDSSDSGDQSPESDMPETDAPSEEDDQGWGESPDGDVGGLGEEDEGSQPNPAGGGWGEDDKQDVMTDESNGFLGELEEGEGSVTYSQAVIIPTATPEAKQQPWSTFLIILVVVFVSLVVLALLFLVLVLVRRNSRPKDKYNVISG